MENDVFLASKELLEILSSTRNSEIDLLNDCNIIVDGIEHKCSIKKIKINSYDLEITASVAKDDCIKILKSAVGKTIMIPQVFGNSFISNIFEIELYDNYNIRITSNIANT